MSTSATDAPADEESRRADVELRVPADNAYASVLRTTTAGLAARLDFPIDDIEDLRIAVGEASAMALPESVPGTDLRCEFFLAPGEMTIRVGVTVDHDIAPDYDSFAWQVLTTLATGASADCADGTFRITLTMESTLPGAGL
ncbi:anti-sigma factor [Nocardioides sp. CN2-186]|uniref:anti-sigma factor n=1 Tax=Nocardioides tweenelious TaxID=3156607 RepID=UPI0032B3CD7A